MNMYIIHPPEFLVISVDCVNQLKYVLLCNFGEARMGYMKKAIPVLFVKSEWLNMYI